jgi:hypothetical protein
MNNLIVYNTVVRKQSEEAMGAVQSLWRYGLQNTAAAAAVLAEHTKVKISRNLGRIK